MPDKVCQGETCKNTWFQRKSRHAVSSAGDQLKHNILDGKQVSVMVKNNLTTSMWHPNWASAHGPPLRPLCQAFSLLVISASVSLLIIHETRSFNVKFHRIQLFIYWYGIWRMYWKELAFRLLGASSRTLCMAADISDAHFFVLDGCGVAVRARNARNIE